MGEFNFNTDKEVKIDDTNEDDDKTRDPDEE